MTFEKIQFGLFNSNAGNRRKEIKEKYDYPSLVIQQTPEWGEKPGRKRDENGNPVMIEGYLSQCGFELNVEALKLMGFDFEDSTKLTNDAYIDFAISLESKRLFVFRTTKEHSSATNSVSKINKTTHTFFKDRTHDYLKNILPWINPKNEDVKCMLVEPAEDDLKVHPELNTKIFEVVLATVNNDSGVEDTDQEEEADTNVSLEKESFFN